MRWDDLFADLAAQFDAAQVSVSEEEIADMARAEAATTALADRLRARLGAQVHLRLHGAHSRQGRLVQAHADWFVLASGHRRSLVPATAIALAWPLAGTAPPAAGLSRRLPFGHALRALAAAAPSVLAVSTAGEHHGRIVRVGRDHLDLATPAAVLSIGWTALLTLDSRP
ncbi:hypothetical protein [Pseudactinotalea sp. HY158]|uniref:hypothetical protein n=1 Tax=Pseudactinotalea sp. HY158 TaxID=2654547 RepID=UPI00129C70AE|nr:hypothetical protein [Pseudactinotalea sp. HY158]QGH68861.1 hypothetical protein GCE65_04625 [Pseudactinotalea sp. HY158]